MALHTPIIHRPHYALPMPAGLGTLVLAAILLVMLGGLLFFATRPAVTTPAGDSAWMTDQRRGEISEARSFPQSPGYRIQRQGEIEEGVR
jgi:hypothetical protein